AAVELNAVGKVGHVGLDLGPDVVRIDELLADLDKSGCLVLQLVRSNNFHNLSCRLLSTSYRVWRHEHSLDGLESAVLDGGKRTDPERGRTRGCRLIGQVHSPKEVRQEATKITVETSVWWAHCAVRASYG